MATRKKKIKYPVHKMGKYCGYDEYEDGSFKPAPMYTDRIDEAMENEASLHAFIKSFTEQMYKLFQPIHKEHKRFWESIRNDYGIDEENFDYSYDGTTKIIRKIPKTKPENK